MNWQSEGDQFSSEPIGLMRTVENQEAWKAKPLNIRVVTNRERFGVRTQKGMFHRLDSYGSHDSLVYSLQYKVKTVVVDEREMDEFEMAKLEFICIRDHKASNPLRSDYLQCTKVN